MNIRDEALKLQDNIRQLLAAGDWDESKHPRDKSGKFGEGVGSGHEKATIEGHREAAKASRSYAGTVENKSQKEYLGKLADNHERMADKIEKGEPLTFHEHYENGNMHSSKADTMSRALNDRVYNHGYKPTAEDHNKIADQHERAIISYKMAAEKAGKNDTFLGGTKAKYWSNKMAKTHEESAEHHRTQSKYASGQKSLF